MPYNAIMTKREATARLEARLPRSLHALLKRAADLEGRTLTDFVVGAAREAATRTVAQSHLLQLSMDDEQRLAEALLHPPKANAALQRAFRRRVELMGKPSKDN